MKRSQGQLQLRSNSPLLIPTTICSTYKDSVHAKTDYLFAKDYFLFGASLPQFRCRPGLEIRFSSFIKFSSKKAAFGETDFAALRQGHTVVQFVPATDKREVAVCGLVSLGVTADMFLESFRESMTKKNDAAILEIRRSSDTPHARRLTNAHL